MKVCLYSPYLPNIFGGGEKHLLDIATHLPKNWEVVFAFSDSKLHKQTTEEIKTSYESFYGKSLAEIDFIKTPLGTSANAFKKLLWTSKFDYLFAVSDGSLFFSLARHNFLHIQIPFQNAHKSLVSRLKLSQWTINANSEFTKNVITESWLVDKVTVLHPMVATDDFTPRKKEKIILNVGRFFRHLHSKRQDVLVDIFRELSGKFPELVKDWQLVLVGSVEDEEYFSEVKKKAANLPVKFITECNRPELISLYERSSIYWHATGFGVNVEEHPEKAEHFGITTVEAMAAGAVPVVFAAGGQPEVIGESLNKLLWSTKEECLTRTAELISKDEVREKLVEKVGDRAKNFGEKQFVRKLNKLFGISHE
ncbi:MAG: hypothetical protein COY80_04650 [Candidatus Pacebacteria bacterium CG_4_10_14_0_8_um_filter_42_14]|nr:MAG: hypothetical protein COY80_04650 [Candidatus Pacebacteria bacterium CG_4_10_14_0_8_um_filter_42_14]